MSIENLACGHGETTLFRGLSACLKPGEAARIHGANGAGKTTLLRTLAGIHRPLAGKIRWCSTDAGSQPSKAGLIASPEQGHPLSRKEKEPGNRFHRQGPCEPRLAQLSSFHNSDDPEPCFIAHENALNNALTPLENLGFLMDLAGQPATRVALAEALEVFGLTPWMHKPCRSLSAGQRRRVTLARLRLTRASLWLLDEPAATLDADSRAHLVTFMDRHVAAGGILLFTTHEDLALTAAARSIALSPC